MVRQQDRSDSPRVGAAAPDGSAGVYADERPGDPHYHGRFCDGGILRAELSAHPAAADVALA